ncbi:MAG: hypothetical protein K0S09_631 [Sphingobacteriaceae bacterium]|jgi:hypothetical protein|nr:hypothetical protein [Sphingobacteriaceae bacterium]
MKKLFIIPALALLALFSSCENDSKSSLTRVNIKMTDGPGSYDALLINVKEVHVITSEGESVLPVNSGTFDILKFRMGKDTLLASQDIPAGKLQEIRLVLNDGNKVVVGGVPYNLTTPSAQSSGLKLKINDDLSSGIEYTLTLDFDAAKSIVQTGNGKYILKPVIRAIPNAVSGALAGTVAPAASAAKVYAIVGTDTTGAIADSTGKFFLSGMQAGTYKIDIVPQSPYQPKSLLSVQVNTGSVTNLGTITVAP